MTKQSEIKKNEFEKEIKSKLNEYQKEMEIQEGAECWNELTKEVLTKDFIYFLLDTMNLREL